MQGGLFTTVCTAATGQDLTSSFSVQDGEKYTVEVYFAETSCVLFFLPTRPCVSAFSSCGESVLAEKPSLGT